MLSALEWATSQKTRFLKRGLLPQPTYKKVATAKAREHIADARAQLDGEQEVTLWLQRVAGKLETTANLIDTRGTAEFFTHSASLFGQPTQFMLDKTTRVLDLARHMDEILKELDFDKLVITGYETQMNAEDFAAAFRPRLARHMGEKAPEVAVTKAMSAKATATSKRIRINAGGTFTLRDIEQLLHHEALIHVATGLNGQAQKKFPILGRSHAGTTEVQEGLAVFAEIITGAMDPRRFRRLSGRVLAIHMAIEGADFKEVYDFFRERTEDPDLAYENTRRVFRGGVITGGAPFTKDMVYLNGLLRVHNFMRTVVGQGRADLIRVLFAGKMDIEDLPALAELASQGLMVSPDLMPPWAKDLRFLVSYMAYSAFLNQVKMPGFQSYYKEKLDGVPKVWGLVE